MRQLIRAAVVLALLPVLVVGCAALGGAGGRPGRPPASRVVEHSTYHPAAPPTRAYVERATIRF